MASETPLIPPDAEGKNVPAPLVVDPWFRLTHVLRLSGRGPSLTFCGRAASDWAFAPIGKTTVTCPDCQVIRDNRRAREGQHHGE